MADVTVADLIRAEWPHLDGNHYALPSPLGVGCGMGRHGDACRWVDVNGRGRWPLPADGLRLWCPCPRDGCHPDRPTIQPALF